MKSHNLFSASSWMTPRRHRVDRPALPDFEICLKMAVMIYWNHLAEEVDPNPVFSGISFFPVEPDDHLVVLIGGFDQWDARHRIFLDTGVNDLVVDLNVEQVVIAARGRAIRSPTIGQSIDKLLG